MEAGLGVKRGNQIVSNWLITETEDYTIWLSAVFVSIPIEMTYRIEYDNGENDVLLNLTRQELEFLIMEPMKFGQCGRITVKELPDDGFVIRNEATTIHVGECDRCPTPVIRIESPVYFKLKCIAKCILDDTDIIKPYISGRDATGYMVLNQKQTCLIKQFISTRARYDYDHKTTDEKLDRIEHARDVTTKVTLQSLNEFLQPSKIAVVDVDIEVILRDYKELIVSQILTKRPLLPSACWITHNYNKSIELNM